MLRGVGLVGAVLLSVAAFVLLAGLEGLREENNSGASDESIVKSAAASRSKPMYWLGDPAFATPSLTGKRAWVRVGQDLPEGRKTYAVLVFTLFRPGVRIPPRFHDGTRLLFSEPRPQGEQIVVYAYNGLWPVTAAVEQQIRSLIQPVPKD